MGYKAFCRKYKGKAFCFCVPVTSPPINRFHAFAKSTGTKSWRGFSIGWSESSAPAGPPPPARCPQSGHLTSLDHGSRSQSCHAGQLSTPSTRLLGELKNTSRAPTTVPGTQLGLKTCRAEVNGGPGRSAGGLGRDRSSLGTSLVNVSLAASVSLDETPSLRRRLLGCSTRTARSLTSPRGWGRAWAQGRETPGRGGPSSASPGPLPQSPGCRVESMVPPSVLAAASQADSKAARWETTSHEEMPQACGWQATSRVCVCTCVFSAFVFESRGLCVRSPLLGKLSLQKRSLMSVSFPWGIHWASGREKKRVIPRRRGCQPGGGCTLTAMKVPNCGGWEPQDPSPALGRAPRRGQRPQMGRLDPTNQASQPRQRFLGPSLAKKLQGPQPC